jgi:hypothetical protein
MEVGLKRSIVENTLDLLQVLIVSKECNVPTVDKAVKCSTVNALLVTTIDRWSTLGIPSLVVWTGEVSVVDSASG